MAERARASAPAIQPRLRGRFEPVTPAAVGGAASAGAPPPLDYEADDIGMMDDNALARSPGRRMDRLGQRPDGPERLAGQEQTAPPLQRLEVTPHAARRDVVPPAPERAWAEQAMEPARSGEGAGQPPGAAWSQERAATMSMSSPAARAHAVRPGEPAVQPGAAQPVAVQPGAAQPGTVQPGAAQPVAIRPGPVQPGPVQRGALEQPAFRPAEPVARRGTLSTEGGRPARDAEIVHPSGAVAPAARGQGLLVPAPVRVTLPTAPSAQRVDAPARTGAPAAPVVPGATASPGAVAAPAPPPAPTIQVTIGRVEVRATAPSTPQRKPRPAPTVMSLDEYLDRNAGGRR